MTRLHEVVSTRESALERGGGDAHLPSQTAPNTVFPRFLPPYPHQISSLARVLSVPRLVSSLYSVFFPPKPVVGEGLVKEHRKRKGRRRCSSPKFARESGKCIRKFEGKELINICRPSQAAQPPRFLLWNSCPYARCQTGPIPSAFLASPPPPPFSPSKPCGPPQFSTQTSPRRAHFPSQVSLSLDIGTRVAPPERPQSLQRPDVSPGAAINLAQALLPSVRCPPLPQGLAESGVNRRITVLSGAAVVQWSEYPPPAVANRVRFPAGLLPDFLILESCWTMPLAGGFHSKRTSFLKVAPSDTCVTERRNVEIESTGPLLKEPNPIAGPQKLSGYRTQQWDRRNLVGREPNDGAAVYQWLERPIVGQQKLGVNVSSIARSLEMSSKLQRGGGTGKESAISCSNEPIPQYAWSGFRNP
ncbi:hypothetical protein PR048_032301 [Dryococelus australis]|uniref:Uncharacterized protein n=1 Tax=Dryococelus australis TaxID=614101 RepID=A0ABQ9G512_9NEOP|nr:hypothetical protein PR048_032301 [Dryococelus australis]